MTTKNELEQTAPTAQGDADTTMEPKPIEPERPQPQHGIEARPDSTQPVHHPNSPFTSQAAYRADLPELLEHHRGDWVAYADGKRLRFGKSQAELYRHCLNDLGLTHDRFVIRRVMPECNPQIEYSLR